MQECHTGGGGGGGGHSRGDTGKGTDREGDIRGDGGRAGWCTVVVVMMLKGKQKRFSISN